ncbi:hypothetical protein BC826DRAFT_1175240 [Russula brevipes]|nr:hypothetical protein BC826DRAFT_1175240 [Russula brevipes]
MFTRGHPSGKHREERRWGPGEGTGKDVPSHLRAPTAATRWTAYGRRTQGIQYCIALRIADGTLTSTLYTLAGGAKGKRNVTSREYAIAVAGQARCTSGHCGASGITTKRLASSQSNGSCQTQDDQVTYRVGEKIKYKGVTKQTGDTGRT